MVEPFPKTLPPPGRHSAWITNADGAAALVFRRFTLKRLGLQDPARGLTSPPRMEPWDSDSEDSCDWGDSSEEASSPEEDERHVKSDTE